MNLNSCRFWKVLAIRFLATLSDENPVTSSPIRYTFPLVGDVYKRQDGVLAGRVDVVFSRRHLFVVEDDDGRAVSGVVAVSYTHLDVYKRQ